MFPFIFDRDCIGIDLNRSCGRRSCINGCRICMIDDLKSSSITLSFSVTTSGSLCTAASAVMPVHEKENRAVITAAAMAAGKLRYHHVAVPGFAVDNFINPVHTVFPPTFSSFGTKRHSNIICLAKAIPCRRKKVKSFEKSGGIRSFHKPAPF